jgi:TolB-like protein
LIYRFEDYALDTDRRELRQGSHVVTLEPQVFDVLECLVRNRERIVTKSDLIAEVWHGRIVSDSTLSSRITGVRHAVADSGTQQRLIRTVSRRGFRFIGVVREIAGRRDAASPDQSTTSRPQLEGMPTLLPEKPSIAVLSFANLSEDAAQEYFADGMSEDLITALSRFRWLFVIARSSTFVYKGRAIDVKQISRELGVRYVLEGSVRNVAKRVRITAQLVDASTGAQLWADRFDGALKDIFDLQDQVTASVVGSIAPKLEQVETERARRKPTESLDAYDHFLRGMAKAVPYSKEGYEEAQAHFLRAIELDPDFAAPYGLAAWYYVTRKVNGWMIDRERETAEAARLGKQAVELAKDDAVALSWGGFAVGFFVDVDDGMAYVDQALVLNPNLAAGWYMSGWLKVFAGKPAAAIEHLHRAIRLSPLDPHIFRVYAGLAYAYFFANQHREALAWAIKAVRERPTWLSAVRIAAACHATSGERTEARRLTARLRDLDPALRVSTLKDVHPFRRSADLAKFENAIRKAGLPD